MKPERLKALIDGHEVLIKHREALLQLARPCVDIALGGHKPLDHESRFGGSPFVPPDFEWPAHPVGDYYFLGQINFADIRDRPVELAAVGLLSLFYALDADNEVSAQDDGYVLGFYWPSVDGFVTRRQPDNAALRAGDIEFGFGVRKISLQGGLELPRHADLEVAWPAQKDAIIDVLQQAPMPEDALLGYPSFNSLAYDPTPGPDWMPLLTIDSHDDFDWCWHDGDKLMVFIERDRLAACDFSNLKADAG